ncbi:uncharacterized protein Dwil_GK16266 [Drosophila willistoni]|uniref:BAH domain-containing protein n=1 Tax=Drosophila willistoni TaxID=7260 RepID=A0A0Q9WTF6_DROWI|nr:uncharacterized protein Dwil_GK16266 [Drosophila willistoni]
MPGMVMPLPPMTMPPMSMPPMAMAPMPARDEAAAAAFAADIAESFTFLEQHAAHHFRDILYAAHMLGRGYYQPAGPLISPHVIAGPPQAQPQIPAQPQPVKKQQQDEDSSSLQPSTPTSQQHPTRTTPSSESEQSTPVAVPAQQPQPYPGSALAAAAAAAAAHPGVPYPRSMHAAQMHYTTAYPPNYYSPYPGEVMCYSPPAYQPYFSSKVYQSAPPPTHPAAHPPPPPPPGAYRRYPYYQHAGPPHPPPPELYEQQPQVPPPQATGAAQPAIPVPVPVSVPLQQQQQHQHQHPTSVVTSAAAAGAITTPITAQIPAGTQLVPAHQQHQQQHLEHYPGPPSYYAGYSPGGASAAGQCYTRTLQGPYMEYPPQCPCPMQQSCPKNVHTGPHIGSNSSSSNNNNSSMHKTSNNSSSNMLMSATSNCNNNSSSNSNSNNMQHQSNASNSSSNSDSTTVTSTTLTTSRGPVKNGNNDNNNISSNKTNEMTTTTTTKATTTTPAATTKTTATSTTAATTNNMGTQCQMLVKTELKSDDTSQVVTKMQYEAHVMPPPTPPESYYGASDDKLLEEADVDTEHHQHQQQQHQRIDIYDLTASTPPPAAAATVAASIIVPRKARIGKSMAREMVYAAQQQQQQQHQQQQQQQLELQLDTEKPELPFVLKAEIKAETKIKIEIEHMSEQEPKVKLQEHISSLLDLKPNIKTEPKESEPQLEVVTASAEVQTDTTAVAKHRFNLLASSSTLGKKSKAHHSYKSLIKQAEPKKYLCPGRKFVRRHGRAPVKYAKRRQLLLTQRQQQRLRAQRREEQQRLKDATASATSKTAAAVELQLTGITNTVSASPKRARPRKQEIAALHLLDSLDTTISRGYFSDPEPNSSSRQQNSTMGGLYGGATSNTPTQLLTSQPMAEKRSKSETKKPLSKISLGQEPPIKRSRKQQTAKTKVKGKKATIADATTATSATATVTAAASTTTVTLINAATETNNNEYQTADLQAQKNANVNGMAADASQIGTIMPQQHSDDPHKFLAPNQPAATITSMSTPAPMPTPTTPTHSSTSTSTSTSRQQSQAPTHMKRARSRCKFGNRKRQKQRPGGVSYEIDDTQPPATRANVVPKWNNGWMWAGKAFQGPVFLNSDDPLVLRTCYPAMRHVEGDIIRTRDCVLLKANEDNELPYVAKVAHLWQNPEDGEMMMSLLWYYRPEHTDQGRQRNDCPDEVYASRHRDHNSVACIEDKCYVLTFSEYCRYRRRLRAAEEDVEDVSIVPRRTNIANCYAVRTVPEHTNAELVMFCRRAYEFRTRRLLKLPQKNGLLCS